VPTIAAVTSCTVPSAARYASPAAQFTAAPKLEGTLGHNELHFAVVAADMYGCPHSKKG